MFKPFSFVQRKNITREVDGSTAKFLNAISATACQSDGKVLYCGTFTNYGGVSGRSYLIRLNSDGSLDIPFCNNASDSTKFNGNLSAIAIDPSDGSIYVGGNFTNYGGVTGRSYLVKLNNDGTINTTFCVNAVDGLLNGTVTSIAVNSNNNSVFIGGSFSNYNGYSGRNCFLKFSNTGILDTTFSGNNVDKGYALNPMYTPTGAITALAIDTSDNSIYTVGGFLGWGATGRNYLAKINSDGTFNDTFCINAVDNNKITSGGGTGLSCVAIDQSNGNVYVGGNFTNYGGTSGRSYMLKLTNTGTIDSSSANLSFYASAIDNKFGATVSCIAINNTYIYAGGSFTSYGGTAGRSYLIKIDSTGSIDTTFCTNIVDSKFSNTITLITIDTSNNIYLSGSFLAYAGYTGRNRALKIKSDMTVDNIYCINGIDSGKINGIVFSVATQSDGSILIGGAFTNYGGVSGRSYLIRLSADGTLDTNFCLNAVDGKINGNVMSIAVQSNGKILVGGNFTAYGTTPSNRSFLIRLNNDGTLDTTFCTTFVDGKFSNIVNCVIIQQLTAGQGGQECAIIGGNFLTYGGTSNRSRIIRIFLEPSVASDSLDTSFCNTVAGTTSTKINASISVLALDTNDNSIYIGGSFTGYGATGRNYLIKTNYTGALDTTFCANAVDSAKFGGSILAITVKASDSSVYVGGNFQNYNSTTGRSRLVKFSSTGALDTAFCANAVDSAKFNNTIYALKVQQDGTLLVGGSFNGYAGITGRQCLIRLLSDGTTDTAFCNNGADYKFNTIVQVLYSNSLSNIYVAGYFTAGYPYFRKMDYTGNIS